MTDDYKYDVFISYSHKDEDWVVNILLSALEMAGLKVCIDYRDFKAGKAAIFNMQDSAKESRHVVLNLTRNWLESEWSLFEALIGATKDPAGLQQKIIPLLSEAGIEKDIHDFISMRSWVDFTRKDREQIAWKMLFTALSKSDAPIPGAPAPAETKIEAPPDWHLAHPYPMPPNFTGRIAERKMLTDWLENDNENRLFILCALGGFGKSALAWHWLTHNVNAKQWPKVIWWSFYEGDASFEHFIEETLKYLNVEIPPGQRTQVDMLFKAMQAQKILLIMDGFERALRLYANMNAAYQDDEEQNVEDAQRDCVNINAEIFLKNLCVLPNMKGKVLMTTRLLPRAVEQRGEILEGCWKEDIKAIQKEDAVVFFRAQGIRGARAEIEAACNPYGYHPLSLRVLAGLIANDREMHGDISVAGKLDITEDVIQNKHHVLEVAYNTLPLDQQKLLSLIACFRSAMTYNALKATSVGEIKGDLEILEHRGLLYWDKTYNKYDLHPIVRRYAYERLTVPDRVAAHTRLRAYFSSIDVPNKVQNIEDLAPAIELYHHIVKAGQFDEATLFYFDHLKNPIYFQFASYQLAIELLGSLFQIGQNQLPSMKREDFQAWALNEIAIAYALSGQPRRAMSLFEANIAILKKMGDKNNLSIALGNLALDQMRTGLLQNAEHNLHLRIHLCREIRDELNEAIGYEQLGSVLSYRGAWKEAEAVSKKGIKLGRKVKDEGIELGIMISSAHRALLMKDYSLSIKKGNSSDIYAIAGKKSGA